MDKKTKKRVLAIRRKTRETDIRLCVNLDGQGRSCIATGIGFLDHMLELFSRHGLFDLDLKAKGDLQVDIHHTNEDIGICLGEAFSRALAKEVRIQRFSDCLLPMDEALVCMAVDVSGRPGLYVDKGAQMSSVCKTEARDKKSGYAWPDVEQFLKAFVTHARITLHILILSGSDFHHSAEAVFKALGRCLSLAYRIEARQRGVPSSKGIL